MTTPPEDAFDVRREPPDGWPTIVRLPLLPSPDEMQQLRSRRQEVERELAEGTARAVASVAECAAAVGAAGQALDRAVAHAREAGATWPEIGAAVGISRQAAAERWGARHVVRLDRTGTPYVDPTP